MYHSRRFLSLTTWAYIAALLVAAAVPAKAKAQPESYPVPPDAEKQEGVPEGKIEGPFEFQSKIYPGTVREYWLYIPAQYVEEKPACSIVVQDGMNRAKDWRLPQIFDNLIHRQEMPVTIGIFVSPGVVPTTKPNAQPRFNRSFEYDSLGDTYARFLLEELLPEVAKSYSLSNDPNDRALAGSSSGGICAFNAAWERPDAFRRVLSTVGTFVGLRGGNELPLLVRKMEPKPLRIFLQDGSNDLNIYAGDWWVANQEMLSSLEWAGYDVQHVWGEGGHNGKHSASIMPDALRWLWRDYGQPISVAPNASERRRTDILISGADWQQISSGHELAEAPTCNAAGALFFCDSRAGRIYRVGEDNKTRVFKDQSGRITSLAFGPKGNLYAAKDAKQIVRYTTEAAEEVVLNDQRCRSLITLPEGFYFSDDGKQGIFFSTYDGKVVEAATLQEPTAAMVATADQAFLHLAPAGSASTLHFQIGPQFRLENRQRYGHLHMPYLDRASGVTSMAMDDQGRAYVASAVGIQVFDQLGRVHLILSKPSRSPITGIAIGGALRDTLYATDGASVYARKLKIKGVASFEPAVTPPKPSL